MLLFLLQNTDSGTNFLSNLFEKYGVSGIVFGVLLTLILRQNKAAGERIKQLEDAQAKQYEENIKVHVDMIEQYVDLVKNKTQVLSDLTACLRAMKETLDRLVQQKN